jgi:NAD dependent epimerase/dehydratase family enzyme
MYLAALGDERWSGPINAATPEPVTNRELSKALGRALHRPSVTISAMPP